MFKNINRPTTVILVIIILLVVAVVSIYLSSPSAPSSSPSASPSQATNQAQIPLPVYPGAPLVNSDVTTETEFNLQFFHGSWETDAKVTEVVQWYTEQLSQQGWTANVPFKESTQQPGARLSVWIPTEPIYAYVEITITPLDSTTQIKVTYFPNMDVLYPEDEEEEEE